MGFVERRDNGDHKDENSEKSVAGSEVEDSGVVTMINKNMSESSVSITEDEDDEDVHGKLEIGPRKTLKEQYEADKVNVFPFLHCMFYEQT